jgi:hypothetical protein
MAFLLDILDFLRSRCHVEVKNGKYLPKPPNLGRKPLKYDILDFLRSRCHVEVKNGKYLTKPSNLGRKPLKYWMKR